MTHTVGYTPSVPIAGRMWNSTAQNHNSGSATFDKVEWTDITFCTVPGTDLLDLTNNRINAIAPGLYRVRCKVEFSANSSGNRREVELRDSSSTVLSNHMVQNPVSADVSMYVEWTGFMTQSNYVEAYFFQNSGANLTAVGGEAWQWMDVVYLGP